MRKKKTHPNGHKLIYYESNSTATLISKKTQIDSNFIQM